MSRNTEEGENLPVSHDSSRRGWVAALREIRCVSQIAGSDSLIPQNRTRCAKRKHFDPVRDSATIRKICKDSSTLDSY